jgi:hypothetical protein
VLVGLGATLAGAIIGAVIGYESGRPSADCFSDTEFLQCADFSEAGAFIGGFIGVVTGACVGVCGAVAISVIREVRHRKADPPS